MRTQRHSVTKPVIDEKKLYREAKQYAARDNFVEAIRQFDALLAVNPKHAFAWFHKAKAHMGLNQLADAMIAFQEVTILSEGLRERAKACLADIRGLCFSSITPAEEKILYTHPSIAFRQEACTAVYLESFDKLIRDHKNIAGVDYDQKLSAIIGLIDFCGKFYTPQADHFPFVKSELVEMSPSGRLARLRSVGNPMAKLTLFNEREGRKYAVNANEPRRYAAMLEEDCCKLMRIIEDDVYLDDAMQVLRMLIESIHQLERDKRGELVGRMPWGKNSWYHLDFCSTFFRGNHKAGLVPISLSRELSEDQMQQLLQFQMSIRYDISLVKAVMPDLLQVDLQVMREFFVAVKAGLAVNDPRRMQDLPTLRPLLWNFKHSYQLLRLTATLPSGWTDADSALLFKEPDIYKNPSDSASLVMTPIQQLLFCKFNANFTQSLKLKLSMLRRVQIVGEVFSKRNWGSQLDELDFMDPDIFTTIRNGFSHPEDLTSAWVIEAIENDDVGIAAIYQELMKFRTEIYEFIMRRQTQMPFLPDLNKKQYREWAPLLQQYWQAVKKMYQVSDTLNSDNYCPQQPLLPPEKMQEIIPLLTGCRAYDKLVAMLKGALPFSLPDKHEFDPELELYPINRIAGVKLVGEEKRVNNENRKSLTTIEKRLSEANREYARLKKVYLRNTKVAKDAQQVALKGVRTAKMVGLPVLAKLAADFFSTFTTDATLHSCMHQNDLLKFLQLRMKLLRQLVFDIPSYAQGDTTAEVLKSQVSTDPDLLYALIYLNTQIMSILNKLNGLHALSGISAELAGRVEYYVLIRNALEHNDPVIDSLEETYIQMASKSHLALCEITLELSLKFYDDIMKATSNELTLHQAKDRPPASPTKQRKAMTLSSGGNSSLFMTMDMPALQRLLSVKRSDVDEESPELRK